MIHSEPFTLINMFQFYTPYDLFQPYLYLMHSLYFIWDSDMNCVHFNLPSPHLLGIHWICYRCIPHILSILKILIVYFCYVVSSLIYIKMLTQGWLVYSSVISATVSGESSSYEDESLWFLCFLILLLVLEI